MIAIAQPPPNDRDRLGFGMVVLLCCGSGAEIVMRFAAQKRILRLNLDFLP
jgi:hypothetical protein